MTAPDTIKKLIDTFDNNLDAYKKGIYNETQVRREFIDPFFKALGWDITNEKGYAEAIGNKLIPRRPFQFSMFGGVG